MNGDAARTLRSSRRRRLWELPAPAHELLLGLALTPEQLRRTIEQTIGRQQAARCRVSGTDSDVLFSAARDLGSRNIVSEAFQKLLDARHVQAVRSVATLRERGPLHNVWTQALAAPPGTAPAVPALLWALLTHPCGEMLQDGVLYDVRCWAFAQARGAVVQGEGQQALQQQCSSLRAELDEARAATRAARHQASARAEADAIELAGLRGELARLRAAVGASAEAVNATPTAVRPTRPTRLAPAAPPSAPPLPPPANVPPATSALTPPRPQPDTMTGRKVLCVGGINGAVHRYRALVEARGASFAHHDGGIEDNLHRLGHQLAAADLVVCQAGCVNHEAYRCVKAHCKRAGTPCIYLDRPSLSRLARELGAEPAGAALR